MPLPTGTNLGRYKIHSVLGVGGMGEVYLAHDITLHRPVAIKLLPADFTANIDRLHRFEREAYAASSLNHPNILTIYESGAEDGHHFIATEYIDGESLRQRIERTHMKLHEVLDISIQVASALAAAHAVGIIHRDIKPDNIMVRRDGYVKVLDFGLAKLIGQEPSPLSKEASTEIFINTEPGIVIGTVSYMSPEQARGWREQQVDGRTDIWSLGCVLYEMVAGRVPFEGKTMSDVIALILHKEPSPLARFAPDVPSELERIVTKALRKEREERYQAIKDLGLDLKSLKQRLEFEAELERTETPERGSDARRTAPNRRGSTAGTAQTGGAGDTRTTSESPTVAASFERPSSAEYIVGEIKHHKRAAALILATLLLTIVGVVYFVSNRWSGKASLNSIAVLPFTNTTGDPNAEYLSDGISESLINSLSKLPQLKVIARSSAFKYKGKEIDPQEVAKKLGVRAIVIGRVVQHSDNLIVSAELVDAREGTQVWGERFNRKVSDILAVQEQIAKQISEKLRLQLTGEEQQRLTKRYTDNTEAYQSYLKGRYYFNKTTEDGFNKSIEHFVQAIRVDPNYALAYAGLADSYYGLSWSYLPAKEAMPKAREAAQKALEIDDSLAEVHTSLALIKWLYDWDWVGAEREFNRAIEVNPNYAFAHQQLGMYLALMGRFDEGLAELRQAQELEPTSLWINVDLGLGLYLARRYDQAIEQSQKTLAMDANFYIAHWVLGLSYQEKGMYGEALAEFQKTKQFDDAPRIMAYLGYVYGVSGRRSEAQKILGELDALSKQRNFLPADMAKIYIGLGDKDAAFAWLDRAYQERDQNIVWLKANPMFDSLRTDPRFADLLRRVGFTP